MTTSRKTRKRILQVVDGYRMGGAENKLLELIRQLDKKKYEVILANVGPSGPLQEQFESLNIEIFDFPRKWAFDPLPMLNLYHLIRQRKIDVVQTTLFWADFMGTIAAKLARAPLIMSWETVSHEGDPYHNSFQRRNGYKFMAKLTNQIVAVSNEVKTSLMKRRNVDPEKIRVIHYGVDLKHFHPNGRVVRTTLLKELNLKSSSFIIGIVARLEPWKGHRFYVEAFEHIAEKHPHVHTLIIGDGSLRPSLEASVKSKNLHARVRFLGVRNDIADLLNCIDLLVLPSLPGEGLPNVLLEAMASQKPVIATDVGGVPELVRNGLNGYVVKSGDAVALQQTLDMVIQDKKHLREMGANALSTVQDEFSLAKQVEAFESIYDA